MEHGKANQEWLRIVNEYVNYVNQGRIPPEVVSLMDEYALFAVTLPKGSEELMEARHNFAQMANEYCWDAQGVAVGTYPTPSDEVEL